jgi:predicted phosphoribosyltransferase
MFTKPRFQRWTIFRDRSHAGRALAELLKVYARCPNLIVLGLPRGGVPVAYEVAVALHAPLDVFVVRKLGTPEQPELAMGAIASGGIRILNDAVIHALEIPPHVIDRIAEREQKELQRREWLYRGSSSEPQVSGKTVILIDDGIATGSSILAAIRALRIQHPARLVVAVPTCAASASHDIRREVDDFVACIMPEPFDGVGEWYEDFRQTTDEEVAQLLTRARQNLPRESPF